MSSLRSATTAPTSMVSIPTTLSVVAQSGVPLSAGCSRASRNTPALTMVAECRKALAGVGACMALGSQKWKGNCADLVKQPRQISSSAGP